MLLNPAIILKSVVFPHPDGPSSVKSSPFLMSMDRSGIMVISPYLFVAFFTVILTLIKTSMFSSFVTLSKFNKLMKPFKPNIRYKKRKNQTNHCLALIMSLVDFGQIFLGTAAYSPMAF